MLKIRTAALAASLALLAACSNLTGLFSTSSTAIQTAVANFQTDVAAFGTGVQGVVTNLNAGIAAAAPDLKMVCGGISVLNGLYQAVAPLAGASAADTSTESLAMSSANALCNAPAPTDIATAVAAGLNAYKTIKSAVETVAPGATAVPAPVAAAPAS